MATTTFNIYKRNFSDGSFYLDLEEKEPYTIDNENWEQYLRETGQSDRADYLLSMSSRKRSPKIWRIRQSDEFRTWSKQNQITVTTSLYGVASCDYDGRIPEGHIKSAIINAIRNGEDEARYYPASNASKPAHLQMVYCFNYNFNKE